MSSEEETRIVPKSCSSYAMVGGDGPNSYAKNSGYQKGIVEATKELVKEAIAVNLDFKSLGLLESSPIFQIADFGCSVGPNTFIAMQNIIESVALKYHSQQHQNSSSSKTLQFQVFFNDHYNNDFNALFSALPPSRNYFAAGVPGSFHDCLFPSSTLHFAHSSYSLHWLSEVPREILDSKSPAWNRDSIQCTGLVKEVADAYLAQFKNDVESFLNARAQELVAGGLMVIVLCVRPNGTRMFETGRGKINDLLATCLFDMAKKGLVSEEKVNSFNLPTYFASLEELEQLIERNGYFSIEKMEKLSVPVVPTTFSPQLVCTQLRAVYEGVIKDHFGEELLDHTFNSFSQLLIAQNSDFCKDSSHPQTIDLFLLLKRINLN